MEPTPKELFASLWTEEEGYVLQDALNNFRSLGCYWVASVDGDSVRVTIKPGSSPNASTIKVADNPDLDYHLIAIVEEEKRLAELRELMGAEEVLDEDEII